MCNFPSRYILLFILSHEFLIMAVFSIVLQQNDFLSGIQLGRSMASSNAWLGDFLEGFDSTASLVASPFEDSASTVSLPL
uniref:Putative ixodes 8-cys protein n=1 Tax=Ixodes ricinus TaxID=34613 RepID=A0A0K8R6P4_IXORI